MENLTSNTNNNNNKQTEKLFISLFLYISTVSVCVGQQLLLLNSAVWINIAMITWWPLEKKKNNIKYVQMDTDRLNSVHYIVFVWQEKCAVYFFLFYFSVRPRRLHTSSHPFLSIRTMSRFFLFNISILFEEEFQWSFIFVLFVFVIDKLYWNNRRENASMDTTIMR